MPIDRIKQELREILAFAVSEKQYNAVKNALIIIDKYQKIEEILNDWKYDDGYKEGQERRILWNIVSEVEDENY